MKKVFVVEDHPVMREMLAELIEREPGLELCGAAASGPSALEQLPEVSPDLVLIDISLPGMSGIELAEKVKARQPDLCMLMISGHEESVYAERALRAGAQGYIMKGDPLMIVSAIQSVLQGHLCFSPQIRPGQKT